MNTRYMNKMNRQAITMRYIYGSLMIILLLIGCAKASEPLNPQMNRTKEQIEFSTVNNASGLDQQPSNKAKELLTSFEELTKIYAVNSSNQMILAFDTKQINRLELASIRKNVKKRLEKQFPEVDIQVSSDAKILREIEKLESDIQSKQRSNKSIEKKVQEIISLSKEQT